MHDETHLNPMALSATLHCLTGCALGEIAGMVIGTALGFSDWGTVALAVPLAFLFGYTLTSYPLLRAGMALSAVVPIALAVDTLSITIMELVDNAIMLLVPGAMEAGLDNELFWGSLSVALVIAGTAAFPVNRWLIQRGRGHMVLHDTGIHGGADPRVVGAVAAVAGAFGAAVLMAEATDLESAGDWIALGLWAVFGLLAFGLRALIQRRRTGDAGFRWPPGRIGSLEWAAGVVFTLALAGGVVGAALNDTLEPLAGSAGFRAAGVAIFLAGLVATLYAQLAMGASWRVGVDEEERTELVTGGPFAIVRNPIFSAMLPASLGLAMVVPNVVSAVSFAALLVSIQVQVRVVEEPYLLRTHGRAYRDYAGRVGRFVPGLGRLAHDLPPDHT